MHILNEKYYISKIIQVDLMHFQIFLFITPFPAMSCFNVFKNLVMRLMLRVQLLYLIIVFWTQIVISEHSLISCLYVQCLCAFFACLFLMFYCNGYLYMIYMYSLFLDIIILFTLETSLQPQHTDRNSRCCRIKFTKSKKLLVGIFFFIWIL